jgi:hypothetical protein
MYHFEVSRTALYRVRYVLARTSTYHLVLPCTRCTGFQLTCRFKCAHMESLIYICMYCACIYRHNTGTVTYAFALKCIYCSYVCMCMYGSYMCVYTCICLRLYVHMLYLYAYMYISVHMGMYIPVLYVYVFICVCYYMHLYVYVCVCICMYLYI